MRGKGRESWEYGGKWWRRKKGGMVLGFAQIDGDDLLEWGDGGESQRLSLFFFGRGKRWTVQNGKGLAESRMRTSEDDEDDQSVSDSGTQGRRGAERSGLDSGQVWMEEDM